MMTGAADLEHVVAAVGDLWTRLSGARLFLTGGTGFFGVWLLESFQKAQRERNLDAEIVVLTRDPEAFRARAPHLAGSPAIKLQRGDVCSFDFPDGAFTHVIHAATPASAALNEQQPLLMLDTIVEGTRRVLELARSRGVKRFLLASSGAVYGRQPPELSHIDEDHQGAPDPLDRLTAYGQGKRMAEHLCALYRHQFGIETLISRSFAFVGPHLPLDAHFAIGNFTRDALAGGPVVVRGDGTPFRSYLYAADLAVWLWTILLRGTPGRAYNIGSEEALPLHEVARRVAQAAGARVEIAQVPVPGRPAERYVPSTRRAAQELGLERLIGLDDAIARTLAWHRQAAA